MADVRSLPLREASSVFFDPPYVKMGNIKEYMSHTSDGVDTMEHFARTSTLKNANELRDLLKKVGVELHNLRCNFLIVKCGDAWLSINDVYGCFPLFKKKQYLIHQQYGTRFNPSQKFGVIRNHTFWYIFWNPQNPITLNS